MTASQQTSMGPEVRTLGPIFVCRDAARPWRVYAAVVVTGPDPSRTRGRGLPLLPVAALTSAEPFDQLEKCYHRSWKRNQSADDVCDHRISFLPASPPVFPGGH